MIFRVTFLFMQLVLAASTTAAAFQLAKPSCADHCGDVKIPFPFGIGENCSLNSHFIVTCNDSYPSRLYLGSQTDGLQITNITMEGQLHIRGYKAQDCYDSKGHKDELISSWMVLEKFSFSSFQNKLVVIGCDSYAHLQGYELENDTALIKTGCNVICNDSSAVRNNTCGGEGCCQVDIPDGIKNISVKASSFNNHTRVWNFNPCTYAFVVQESEFDFTSDLLKMPEGREFPVVLEWAIDNSTDKQSKELLSSMCKEDHHSTIINPDNVAGYRCKCMEGYEGNPHLKNGCQKIDECKRDHDCRNSEHCNNLDGTYRCSCPKGPQSDKTKDGRGRCPDRIPLILAIIGVTCGVALIFTFIAIICYRIQKRKLDKRKEKFFIDNGGMMFRNLISSYGKRNVEKVIFFKEDVLMKATNNFNSNRIVGQGASGNVYKGTIGSEVVAIKRSKVIDSRQIEQFINEVMILSQINHPNVVKLVGCCLETEVPLLVYEFAENKTLEHHIVNERCKFPWEARLRIAVETAGAIAHMHEAQRHIIHRDIKSANILLDKDFTAKVSDFGASRFVPLDQTQLSTMIQGTFGYLDPEYHQTGLLNNKSDVYSFGVILIELLIGESVISFRKKNNNNINNLKVYFKHALREDRLFDIIDEKLRGDKEIQTQLEGVAEVARKCLSEKSEMRPTMVQVKTWLEELMNGRSFQIATMDVAVEEDSTPLFGLETNYLEISTPEISFYSLEIHSLQNLSDGEILLT